MCGFAGLINLDGLDGSPEERLVHLRRMGAQLSRRGPDDEQFYDDGLLSLVFRRLSIIDLGGGRQPLWNEDKTVLATVNGEIYNHREIRERIGGRHTFETESDSEVVVHLYEEFGLDLANHLNGMFAFLVWDLSKRRFLLSRDRLGIKPMHFARIGSTLIFGSELKAMLAHPLCPRELDWKSIERGRISRISIASCVQGIECLRGGFQLVGDGSGFAEPKPYWRLEDSFAMAAENRDLKPERCVEEYGDLLKDSVEKRMMSDVGVGLFLSGGIDSSLLAAMAVDTMPDLNCFTVVEKTTLDAGDVEEARRTTERLKLPYHPVGFNEDSLLSQLNYSLDDFEHLIWAVEKPFFNFEWLIKHELHRYAKSTIPDLKVILLGQGADEFAGGYSRSMGIERENWNQYVEYTRRMGRDSLFHDLGIPVSFRRVISERYPPGHESSHLAPYHDQMVRHSFSLQAYNLWHEDRTSSAQGIESRVPFLDHRLVEYLASLPPSFHESLFFNKRIVRKQFERWLPQYPPEKLKVRFYQTGRRGVHRAARNPAHSPGFPGIPGQVSFRLRRDLFGRSIDFYPWEAQSKLPSSERGRRLFPGLHGRLRVR